MIAETDRIKSIFGNAKAGYDLWVDQDIEGYIELGQADAQRETTFCVLLAIQWKVYTSMMMI